MLPYAKEFFGNGPLSETQPVLNERFGLMSSTENIRADCVREADFDEGVFAANRFGFRGLGFDVPFKRSFDVAFVADLGKIPVGKGTVLFNWLDGGARVAQMIEFVLLSFPQQESASFVPTHANTTNVARALIVSSKMFAVRAARK